MSFFGNRRQQAESPPPPVAESVDQPRPITPQQPVGFETVLGANCTVEGTLRSNANVRLDGTFTGTLEISGNVLVGETAKINADIHAKNVSIAGAVRGNVSGKKVQLLRTGRVWGDITAAALTTEEGAFIDGKITMVSHDQSRPESGSRDATLILDDNPLVDETVPEQQPAQEAAAGRGRKRQRNTEEKDIAGSSGETSESTPDEQNEQ
jgi:cytoskeletal protein CcmA (bactofilin family)